MARASTAAAGVATSAGSTRTCSTPTLASSATWPRTVAPSARVATRSTAAEAAGTTATCSGTPSSSATCTAAAARSPSSSSASAASRTLPAGWPSRSPPAKRRSSAEASVARAGSASAVRQRRRSPGAGRSVSARIRPELPPSSATDTTAVSLPVQSTQASKVAASPWPPPTATTAGAHQLERSMSRWVSTGS